MKFYVGGVGWNSWVQIGWLRMLGCDVMGGGRGRQMRVFTVLEVMLLFTGSFW